jgi:hypothetical protein
MMYTPRTALMMAEGSTALFYEFHACEHAISPNVSVHKFGKPPRLRSWTYPGTPASISVISEGAFSSPAISRPRISTRNPVRKPATSLPLRRYTTQSNYAAGLHALRITFETSKGASSGTSLNRERYTRLGVMLGTVRLTCTRNRGPTKGCPAARFARSVVLR